jgi:hypothetical protein
MPNVGGKKFSYDAPGRKAANEEREKAKKKKKKEKKGKKKVKSKRKRPF